MLGRLQGHVGDSAGMVFLSLPGRGLADALAELLAFCPNSWSSSSHDSSVLLPWLFSDWKVEVEMAGLLKFHCFGCDAVPCRMSINGSCGWAQPKGGASGWSGGPSGSDHVQDWAQRLPSLHHTSDPPVSPCSFPTCSPWTPSTPLPRLLVVREWVYAKH